jgi:hypothetical protein
MQVNTHLHSRYCLNGEVYRGNRHHDVCEHVGLLTYTYGHVTSLLKYCVYVYVRTYVVPNGS